MQDNILSDLTIKPITQAPVKELISLYKEAGWWESAYDDSPGFLQHIVKKSTFFIGAFKGKKLIGMGRALSDGVSDAYIQDVTVLKAYRGNGIGKKIIQVLVTCLRENGVDWIGLVAEPGTDSFYKTLGFEVLKDHIALKYKDVDMYIPEQISQQADIQFPVFKSFSLEDRSVIQSFTDNFQPMSCEYSFANLFAWQKAYHLVWTIYQGRLLIYDGVSDCSFMPIGEEFTPEELAILSLNLKKSGKMPDFALVTPEYIEKFPELKKYYRMRKNRNFSEYIYDVETLYELPGPKLHKKRNLISQFKRLYPDFKLHVLKDGFKQQALEFTRDLKNSYEKVPQTLVLEFGAIQTSFEYFESLGLEGLAITHEDKMIAFSVFSQLGDQYFDIHFEKSDMAYKGAAQVINQETALYLKNRCKYLNREQDLGIKGLRQAKMSYEPVKLITPVKLFFAPLN